MDRQLIDTIKNDRKRAKLIAVGFAKKKKKFRLKEQIKKLDQKF